VSELLATTPSATRAGRPPAGRAGGPVTGDGRQTMDIDKLEQLAKAATPGEWHSGHKDIVPTANILYIAPEVGEFSVFVFDKPGLRSNNRHEQFMVEDADAAYIAAANPQTVLALLSELRALRALLQEAMTVISDYVNDRMIVGSDLRTAAELVADCRAALTEPHR
jgi:hypothetical protein